VRRLLPLLALTLLSPPADAFDLQAHRGGRALAPENTLPAFAHALSMGVTTLELDTGVTKDGVVVVCHDPSLNPNVARGPDGRWLAKKGPAIHELTLAELSAYDVGRLNPESSYGRQFPDQKPVDGTRIPRLADLFALVKKSGNTQVRFNIETKVTPTAPDETLAPEPFTRAVLAVIREAGMQERVTIQSFDWRTLQLVQKLAPRIPTVYLTAQQKWLDNIGGSAPAAGQAPGPSPWTAGVQLQDHGSIPRMVRAAGGTIWSPYYGEVDAETVAEAKALGLRTVVWTVNQPAAIEKMLDLGVDGIISDRPDLVRAEMKKRGMPLPAATPVSAGN
jgi:glycerophosphoryl diester phosphodiesterase